MRLSYSNHAVTPPPEGAQTKAKVEQLREHLKPALAVVHRAAF